MIKVVIIGSGNVAQHLIAAFENSKRDGNAVDLIQVFARKREKLVRLLDSNRITDNYAEIVEADLYIIAVSDHAIMNVVANLNFKNRLVVHTSGSFPINALNDSNRRGVFYPLQTFSKNKAVNFKLIPICLESENATDFQLLSTAAKTISESVFAINSKQRKALHVAAVFVNNFTNYMYQMGHQICQEHHVPFEILKPLIAETANKIMVLSPQESQTGPAIRNDSETLQAHQDFLSDENQLYIYKIITLAIQKNGKKL
ncbi:putative short-subunit dehydrogenase-like oxidoreductase (DUF2520 family) [Flavobacterium sp. PL11]|uniref:Rossmann-like and DUF2520 domain-containing protein n=1 Tax=Flavobacterium sp. PL11 TaxID=3071717 RepID=UPI002DFE7F6A|nr:putative short-subunit dehydrogenase-like oxidoreductase (DUF2520 family) [Flavobacterium sp. PL11]